MGRQVALQQAVLLRATYLGGAACFEHNAADGAWKAQVLLLGNLLV